MFRNAVIAIVLVLTAVTGCTRTEPRGSTAAAPDFSLPDLSGRAVRLADLKGKVVLVEFWATWCPPCRESIPGMERLHRTYNDKGLVVLGVSLDAEGWDSVRSFTAEHGITYPVLQGSEGVSSLYSVRVIPTMVLVNRDGMIARHYLGGGREEDLEKDIRALL